MAFWNRKRTARSVPESPPAPDTGVTSGARDQRGSAARSVAQPGFVSQYSHIQNYNAQWQSIGATSQSLYPGGAVQAVPGTSSVSQYTPLRASTAYTTVRYDTPMAQEHKTITLTAGHYEMLSTFAMLFLYERGAVSLEALRRFGPELSQEHLLNNDPVVRTIYAAERIRMEAPGK